MRRGTKCPTNQPSILRTRSAIICPIASEAVAAGEGALHTLNIAPVSSKAKSSMSFPSEAIAWARMPADAGTSWSIRIAGTKRCKARQCRLAQRALHFAGRRSPMPTGKSPKAGRCECRHEIGKVGAPRIVSFTPHREHGIRPALHGPRYHAREVNTKKWKCRIRYGVDEVLY